MKYLGSAVAIAILAGCSQEALDFSQTPVSTAPEPQIQPAVEPETLPEDPALQPGVTVPSTTEPIVVTPAKVIDPIEVTPVPIPPKKTPEETNPAETELSPAEIVARKLISDDPEENLEVLNEALQMWLATKGELPEKIGDLVAEQLLPMLPMAPQGKIFEIDREAKRVVLVAEK